MKQAAFVSRIPWLEFRWEFLPNSAAIGFSDKISTEKLKNTKDKEQYNEIEGTDSILLEKQMAAEVLNNF